MLQCNDYNGTFRIYHLVKRRLFRESHDDVL